MYSLAVSGSDLYAGGSFTNAGGSGADCIAKWNGSSWSALGSGIGLRGGVVYALAVSGSDVYAGGFFTTAGGSPATNIAKWNGSSWSALGSGIRNGTAVNALAVSGSNLYAGGFFTTAGGTPAKYIAKWNGSGWSPLGSGMDFPVYALAVSGSDLYAGGQFTNAGGSAAGHIARWNGSTWSPLASGIAGVPHMFGGKGGDLGEYPGVYALAVSGSDLYAGGKFTIAGGKISAYVARAYLERPSLSAIRSGGDVTLSWPTFYETFVLQQNPDIADTDTWSNANYPLTTNGPTKSAIAPITPTNHFFRLIGN